MIDYVSGMTIKNSYDYDLASVVVLRQYLPNMLGFILVVVVLSGFMLSFANYILAAVRSILKNIIIPNKIFAKYGEAREIWVIRLSLLALPVIITAISEVYLPYFVLIKAIYVLSAVFMAPLFAMVILSVIHGSKKSYISILLGMIVAVFLIFVINLGNELSKYALITYLSFAITLLSGFCFKGYAKSLEKELA